MIFMKNHAKIVIAIVLVLIFFSGCIEKTGLTVSGKKTIGLTEPELKEPKQIQKSAENKTKPESISFLDKIKIELIPTGKPEYGDGVLHFAVQGNSLNKMVEYNNEITLSEEETKRFKKIALQAFCEFCCGPAEIGKCSCRHAAGYKGIVKYLIKNYPDYSDEKIILEQEKWKASFFQKGVIYKHLKEQKELGKVSEEEINEIEEMIGTC